MSLYCIPPYYILEVTVTQVRMRSYSGRYNGKEIKPHLDNGGGYATYGLYDTVTGKTRTMKVHRLVAEAVFGPCPKGMQVNHKDGVKTNNHPSNLEYVTASENVQHAFDKALRENKMGPDSPFWKGGARAAKLRYKRKLGEV